MAYYLFLSVTMSYKKDKILFWLEYYSIHFGIAKALSEKYNCELYALVSSSPKQKSFFDNQKLVKFKKIWFVRDHVNLKNHQPNLDKLKFLENKFSIQLGKIIYGDRLFYKFNKYHLFTDYEIFSIIEQELEFYEHVLNEIKPDYVVMRAPEFQDIELFYELCKAKKIPILVLSSMKFGMRWIISSKPYPTIQFDKSADNLEIKSFDILRNNVEQYSKLYRNIFSSKGKTRSKPSQKFNALKLVFSTFNSSNINSYRDVGKTPWKILSSSIYSWFMAFYRKSYLNKNAQISLPLNRPYVYFPLHMEPDVSTLRIADFYEDQINIIKNIVQSLPIEMTLFVKEHPSMWLTGWRNTKFYRDILKLPNVQLIHPSVSSENLITNSSLVITIAGTTALEATFYGKPVIVFSDINCSSLSSVSKINNLEDLPIIIRKCLDLKVDLVELNHFVDKVEKSTFICDVENLNVSASNFFGVGGMLTMNEISESQMKEFLEEYKNDFDILATEHIKKIELIKQNDNNYI